MSRCKRNGSTLVMMLRISSTDHISELCAARKALLCAALGCEAERRTQSGRLQFNFNVSDFDEYARKSGETTRATLLSESDGSTTP